MRDSDFILLLAMMVVVALFSLILSPSEPNIVYVGTNCEGPSALAVAKSPKNLPACAEVAIHEVQ